jgi:hypothetical protein
MTINGKPKDEETFRHIMGYVEQFDSLSPRDTAREVTNDVSNIICSFSFYLIQAVEFSAAMRLSRGIDASLRMSWVTSVIAMLG